MGNAASGLAKKDVLSYKAVFLLTYLALLFGVLAIFHDETLIDYNEYVGLSYWSSETVTVWGEQLTITEPFASRLLAPFIAHAVSSLTGWSTYAILAVMNIAMWCLMGPIIADYLWRKRVPLPQALTVATLPYPLLAATHYIIPDSFSVVFLLLILLHLEKGQTLAPAVATFLQMLARNTSLLTIIGGLVALRRHITPVKALAVLAAAGIGLFVLAKLRPFHADNVHHMSIIPYLLFKVPVNFAKNLLGISFYTNTISWCQTPQVIYDVPAFLHAGAIKVVGFCQWNWVKLLATIVTMIFILGPFPFLVLKQIGTRLRDRSGLLRDLQDHTPQWIFLGLFCIIPGLGVTVPRLAIEAYPFLILIMPSLSDYFQSDKAARLALLYNGIGLALLAFDIPLRYAPAGL